MFRDKDRRRYYLLLPFPFTAGPLVGVMAFTFARGPFARAVADPFAFLDLFAFALLGPYLVPLLFPDALAVGVVAFGASPFPPSVSFSLRFAFAGADLNLWPFLGLYFDYGYTRFNVEQKGDIEDIYPLYDIYHILSAGSCYNFRTGNLSLRAGGGFSYAFETVDYGPPDPYGYTRWPGDDYLSGPGLHISIGTRYPIINSVFQVLELRYSVFYYDKRLEYGMFTTRDHSPLRTEFLNLRVGLEVGII